MARRVERPLRKSFPLAYLTEGKTVVVVGGGKIGARKAEALAASGARVLLVAPELGADATRLVAEGRLTHRAAAFRARDLQGASLCFACTDDRAVNRRVLEAARKAFVPCCCADGNWPEGDFTTPATVRTGDLAISVSTGGKSCRLARMVKDEIARALAETADVDLFVLGTDHELLSAEKRAPYHLDAEARRRVSVLLKQVRGVREFMLLNTCNRIELLAVASARVVESGILQQVMGFGSLPAGSCRLLRGFEAFSHLCAVASGMDSQIPGEFHVVSQLKTALAEAEEQGAAGAAICEWTDAAFHVSKDVRAAIGSLLDVEEIEDVALRFLDHAIKVVQGRRALVLGTGVLGRALVAGLVKRGFACTWLYHRNRPTAVKGVKIAELSSLGELLPSADLVMSALEVRTPEVDLARHREKINPHGVFFIDLGMPRNIDPALAGGNVRIADLDVLKQWCRAMSGTLGRAQEICRATLAEHRSLYERMMAGF